MSERNGVGEIVFWAILAVAGIAGAWLEGQDRRSSRSFHAEAVEFPPGTNAYDHVILCEDPHD